LNWIKKIIGVKPSRDEFADIAKMALQKYSNAEDIIYDQENYSLSARVAEDLVNPVYFLGNAFEEYCLAPRAAKESVLQTFFGSHMLVKIPSLQNEALPNLLPRVQPRSYFEESALQAKAGDFKLSADKTWDLPFAIFAEHFGETLIFDTPTAVLQVDKDKLAEWNVQLESTLHQAMQNLNKITPEPFQEVAPGLYVSQYQDSHDASRLLLLERIKECKVQGRPVAMIPNRNILIVTGESDHANHSLMLNIVEEAQKQPRPMPAFPVVLSERTWHLWQPGQNHSEKQRFDYFSALSMLDIYNTQKSLLDKIHEKEKIDLFTANYIVYQKKETGDICSATAWTEGVHAFLPVVDKVSFVRVEEEEDDSGVLATAPWDAVQKILGSSMRPLGTYPERYEVESFPNELQLAELKKYSE